MWCRYNGDDDIGIHLISALAKQNGFEDEQQAFLIQSLSLRQQALQAGLHEPQEDLIRRRGKKHGVKPST
jgi:hypothetical protein